MSDTGDNMPYRPEGGLLATPAWTAFQRAMGADIVHAQDRDVLLHRVPVVGRYGYLPRGAAVMPQDLVAIAAVARSAGCGWLRIEPDDAAAVAVYRATGLQVTDAPHDVQPRCVLQLDLTPSAEVIMATMKPKHRYNIRLAERKGVTVTRYVASDAGFADALDTFCRLVGATAGRKGVRFHDAAYYAGMFAHLPEDMIALYVATYQGRPLAANIMTYAGGVATYLHGGTAATDRAVMAPLLAQWHQMLDAKARGCDRYDFGGMVARTSRGNDMASVMRFKDGFAPTTKPLCLPGACDVVLVPWRYGVYRMLLHLRSLMGK